jgi:hypothetical protein
MKVTAKAHSPTLVLLVGTPVATSCVGNKAPVALGGASGGAAEAGVGGQMATGGNTAASFAGGASVGLADSGGVASGGISSPIQVSTDNTTWTDVYSTTTGASYSVTDVNFAKTTALCANAWHEEGKSERVFTVCFHGLE